MDDFYKLTGPIIKLISHSKKKKDSKKKTTNTKNLATIHCSGHQKGLVARQKGNMMAYLAEKQVALREK